MQRENFYLLCRGPEEVKAVFAERTSQRENLALQRALKAVFRTRPRAVFAKRTSQRRGICAGETKGWQRENLSLHYLTGSEIQREALTPVFAGERTLHRRAQIHRGEE